jgi:hypothetical protein
MPVVFSTLIKGIRILGFAPGRAFRRKETVAGRNKGLGVRAT